MTRLRLYAWHARCLPPCDTVRHYWGFGSTTKRRLRGQLLNSECGNLVHDLYHNVCFHQNVAVSLCGNELKLAKQGYVVTQGVSMHVGKSVKACFGLIVV